MKKSMKDISVLVIEDEPALNAAYLRILQSEGIVVTASFNGMEALKSLESLDPDVILLDLKMPRMSGLEFLAKFSKLEPKRKSKIIIFSNYDKQAEIDEAFSLGAKKYMLKAWASPKELIKVVKETVQAD
jgi:two-component system response regulator YesN